MNWWDRLTGMGSQSSGGRPGPAGMPLAPEAGAPRVRPSDALSMLRAQPMEDPIRANLERALAVGPNVLNQLNRIGGANVPVFDQQLGYGDVFRNAGYSPAVATGLGLAADFAEPGPDMKALAAAGGALAMAVPRQWIDNAMRLFGPRTPDMPVFRQIDASEEGLRLYSEGLASLEPGKREFVTHYPPEVMAEKAARGDRFFLNENGAGYIIDHEGDLQAVFNASDVRGMGRAALEEAIANGAVKLDAFDVPKEIAGVNLPEYYGQFGFVEVDRMPWNDAYAPQGWDYEKYGRPDIVFMRRMVEEAAP